MNANAKMVWIGGAALALGIVYFTLAKPADPEPPKARPEPNYFAFVRSMEGTKPDGDIKLGAADRLLVDAELGHLFDYYLAGLGEKGLEPIKAEIERELDRRLKPEPASEAKRLLASYLDYKRALVELERGLPKTADMAQAARSRMDAMQQLRRNYFSAAEIKGLFGAGDDYDADAIARIEISQDPSLNAAQRQDKLATLDANMPRALREERQAPGKVMKMEESVQKMRAQGAGDDEIYRMRAAAISPQAAARLADLDREEIAWKNRIASYLALRNTVLSESANQPNTDQELALQQLRDVSFTPDEQRRLGAYE